MMSKENVFNNVDNVVISSENKKFVAVKFLSEETIYFGVEKKCKVNELFSKICVHLGLADCAELFGLAIRQINYPTSLFTPLKNTSNYYSASQVEESIKKEDTQYEEEYIFLNPNAKLSKYTSKHWKNSKNGLDSMGKAYLECYFRVQFYVDSYLFITDRTARHMYYLQLRQNVINYNLAHLTLERAFLLTSLALQAEKGNYENQIKLQSKPSTSILNSTFLNNSNQLNKCYFDPYHYMPSNIIHQIGENYIIENMPTMHKEQTGINQFDAEIMFIKEASEICPFNFHMYRLFKTNPSSFNKKFTNVNSHFNAFFHGHHFNSSINSNSSHSSTVTNHSNTISNKNHSAYHLNSSLSNKESKVWLAIAATGVQLFEQDKQIFLNKSNNNSFLDLNVQNQSSNQDQTSSNVCYLRRKLSTFIWQDIEKLFFDKKKFEIRSNGYPARKFTYYTDSDEMAKNLLWLCKMSHRFQLFIQPKLKEMKKRESELSRRKYRESYIYSGNDLNDKKDEQTDKENKEIKTENWLEYQQEPSNKCLYFNRQENQNLSSSRTTLTGKGSLNLSQNNDFHLSPLSDEMKPIIDKFDRQISKLQFNQNDENPIDLSATNNLSLHDKKEKSNKSTDQIDFMSGLNTLEKYNQLNTNPFLDKSNYSYQMLFNQQQLENLDEFVIEHKENEDSKNYLTNLNKLTVQPSKKELNDLLNKESNLQLNEQLNQQNAKKLEQSEIGLRIKLNNELEKPNKQTFSLESLTFSGLSEPSSSGISEQEFGTNSLNERKNNSIFLQPNNININHQNIESPNSTQSRCSSNTSYSSDSALGKCSKLNDKKQIQKSIESPIQKIAVNNCFQKLKQYAYSVNHLNDLELNKKDNYSTINNNHLLEDFNQDLNKEPGKMRNQIVPKPRARKSKFELKNKNKLNEMYKSLPNVNNFNEDCRFGRLEEAENNNELIEKEGFNFSNRSDKSTSSEQSVSTIKSNTKTNSSTKLNEEKFLATNQWKFTKEEKANSQDAVKKAHIYENLPFQKSVNNLLMNEKYNSSPNNRTPITPTTSSFLPPSSNLIATTPNRIATKIGVSSLNRCNKINSAYPNSANKNLRLNLLNTSFDKQTNLRTCSYQLLNNESLLTINNQKPTSFKTTRASSDPGVLTYSSTGNLIKVQSKDSSVFYHNTSPGNNLLSIQSPQLIKQQSSLNYNPIDNYQSIYYRSSLNNISNIDENTTINVLNLAYDQSLIDQINNQRKMSIRKNQNYYPLRLAESEMNLISNNTERITFLPPPSEFDATNNKFQATSERKINTTDQLEYQNLSLKNQTESINLQLKQKNHDFDQPLITHFNDKSMMVPKTVPNCSRQQHEKPKRYSWNLENNSANDLKVNFSLNSPSNLCSQDNSLPYQQTNLDESTIFDIPANSPTTNHLKYDNNYNNLDSNNLNTLNKFKTSSYQISQNNKADYNLLVDKIWSEHFN